MVWRGWRVPPFSCPHHSPSAGAHSNAVMAPIIQSSRVRDHKMPLHEVIGKQRKPSGSSCGVSPLAAGKALLSLQERGLLGAGPRIQPFVSLPDLTGQRQVLLSRCATREACLFTKAFLSAWAERFIGSGDNLVSIFHSMSIHINSPSRSVSVPYPQGTGGIMVWKLLGCGCHLWWDP